MGLKINTNHTFWTRNIFRSFIASLIDKFNEKSNEKLGIIAVSLNSESNFDKLVGQDFVFNAVSISKTSKNVQKVSSLSDVLVTKKLVRKYCVH